MKRSTTISTSILTTSSRNGKDICCSTIFAGRNNADTGSGFFEKK